MGAQIIVINGQRYDAQTGRLLEQTKKVHPSPQTTGGTVLDGFSRRPKASKPVVAHSVHKKTEKSKTLMRGAVKKPASQKLHAKAHPASHTVKHVAPKATQLNHPRLERASSIPKSSLVSRFGGALQPAEKQAPKKHVVAHLPVKQAPVHHTAETQPNTHHRARPANPFDAAVENATSHEQAKPAKLKRKHKIARALHVSPRVVSVGTTALAVVLLGGFFVYQNIPNMAMRVAAARSGVNAHMPGYKPGGYAMNGPITYSAGKITISYKSTSDNRNYKVSQSSSQWNSETLLENYVSVNRRSYQTFQDKGRTIYIYDGNNATWVDRGVWYQIEGAASLSSDQLLRIANSL